MTKSIKDIATDAFMAGRKSMELEFESKGRAIQRPIDAQIKDYTKEIEAIIKETRPKGYEIDEATDSTTYEAGWNDGIEQYEDWLIEALYGKED